MQTERRSMRARRPAVSLNVVFIGVELDKRTFCARPITDNGPNALPETLRRATIKLQDSFVGQPYAGAYL